MKPILIDFPYEFETERLHIRYPMPGDGTAVHQAIQSSIEELKPWMPFAQSEQMLEDVEANIRDSHADFLKRTDLRFLLFNKKSGAFIGSSGLHRIDWNIRKFEIGYWIDSKYSGQGFMSEAVNGISDFAFDHLEAKRVEIRCNKNNLRSRKVAERSNFDLEAILRNETLSIDGKVLIDTCVYAKITK